VTDLLSRPFFRLNRLARAGLALACVGCLSPLLRAVDEHAQLEAATSEALNKIKDLTDAKDWDGALALLLNLQPNVAPTSYDYTVITEVVSKIYMQKGDYPKALETMQQTVSLADSYDYLEPKEVQELVYYLALMYNQESGTLKSPALQQQYLSKSTDYAKRWLDHNDKTGQDPQRQEVMLFYVNVLYNRAVLNPAVVDLKLMKKCEAEIENCLLSINHPRETFYVLLLACYQQEGNFARAAEILELLAKKYPAKKEYWAQLVPIYLNLAYDKDEETGRAFNVRAIVTLERAQALGFMRTPKENFTLVGLYFNVGQFGKATELLHTGLRNGSIESDQTNWQLLASCYQQVDKPYQAIDALKEAAQRFPKTGQLDYQAATIYYSLEKPEDAYRYLTIAIAKGHLEKPYAVYNFLAYVDYELTKFDEAQVAVDKALASPGSEHEAQLPRLKQAIEEALKEREQLKAGIRTH
jgi:tetratricopeptide (TPR) repeat protein